MNYWNERERDWRERERRERPRDRWIDGQTDRQPCGEVWGWVFLWM